MPKIAIISDSHDQIANLRAAVHYCNDQAIEVLVHCGDLISPFMLPELAAFHGQVHLIYGNNAGDQHLISSRTAIDFRSITHHGVLGQFTFCGLSICLVHYPDAARGLAAQDRYDIVCCGHSHQPGIEWHGNTLLVNPGQMLGEDDSTGFTILDCADRSTQRINVGQCMFEAEVRVRSLPAQIAEVPTRPNA